MSNRTPQQIADQLNSLRAQAVSIVEGTIAGAANPGGSITFTYVNPIDHQPYTATGTAWNQCVPSKVSALKQTDGSWIVVGQHESAIVREAVHTDRRARPQPETGGKVKILFSRLEGGKQTFYIGGDRKTPKKIYELPSATIFSTAVLHNTGSGDRYIVGLMWTLDIDGIDVHRVAISATSEDFESNYQLESYYGGTLNYHGYGFWTQHPIMSQDELVNFYYGSPPLERPIGLNNGLNLYGGAYTYRNSGSNTSTGSGTYSNTKPSTASTDIVVLSVGYAFNVESSSLYKGLLSKTMGSISSNTSGGGNIQYDFSRGFRDGITHLTGSYSQNGSQSVPLKLSPDLIKTSTTSFNFFGSASLAPDQFGAYENGVIGFDGLGNPDVFPTSGTLSLSYNSFQPILVGQGEQSLYRNFGVGRVTSTDAFGNVTSQSFPRSIFSDHYLVAGRIETKLGGDLPMKISTPTIVEFRVSDNLVNSRCFRVQLDSSIFSLSQQINVDAYTLSASTQKGVIRSKVYSIPPPATGMPISEIDLAALTERLRNNLPATIGNITVYNASYHP